MRYTSMATLAAACFIGSAGLVYAQGNQQFGQGNQGGNQQQFGQGGGQQQFGQSSGGSRFESRSALRQQLRQLGFQNIRILDTTYLVQASTPQGRTVLMVVDPPGRFGVLGSQMGQQGQQQSGQQDNQSVQQGQRSGMGQNQGASSQSGGGSQSMMSESQVRSMLQQQGLTNIQNLQREGDTYTAAADWQGEQVDVSVNARTGEITQPGNL
jgi:hypothetical protein